LKWNKKLNEKVFYKYLKHKLDENDEYQHFNICVEKLYPVFCYDISKIIASYVYNKI
jgi:hypothetical protein